jgi:uroporphyrin-III C-methyltransferase/precorrin-2 dehydrogenase/sirohydrochlorin ferrochelatase
VVFDRLVGPQLLDLVRRDAERIHVGGGNRPALPQAEINALLARLADEGKCVVRLKSGDPLVFARGGEELAYLRRRGVTVEVVPGITAALGCAAAVGLSVTHRDRAQVVSLVAGEAGDGEPAIDWSALARPRQTLAIYMGVGSAGLISRRLIEGGLPANTPVAVVENGTLPDQRGAVGRLGGLKSLIRATGIEGPAIVFIGDAASEASAGSESPRRLAQVG